MIPARAKSGVLWTIDGCGDAACPPEVAGRLAEIEQSTRARIPPLIGDGGIRYAAFWDRLNTHLPSGPAGSWTWSASRRPRSGQDWAGPW